VHRFKYDKLSFGFKIISKCIFFFKSEIKSGHLKSTAASFVNVVLFHKKHVDLLWPLGDVFSMNTLEVFTIHSRLYLRTENILL